MKKSIKITLLILALLTVMTAVASIIMLPAVLKDTLLYMNSTLGYLYAISYRWVCLVFVLLLLFWILLTVKYRKTIKEALLRLKPKKKPKVPARDIPTESASSESKPVYCTNCGKQRPIEKPFCPFCGQPQNTKEE